MIAMAVRADDLYGLKVLLFDVGRYDVRIAPGIDDNRLSRLWARDDIGVGR